MRILSLYLLVALAVVAVVQAAEARPPFFIRYIDVADSADGKDVLVADVVNPRNASVLLKAYVRPGGVQEAALAQSEADFSVDPVSVLIAPASRRKLEFPAAGFPQGSESRTFELVIEQQPKYFASRQSLGMPDSMTITTYVVEIVVPGAEVGGAIQVGEVERRIRQEEAE